MVDLYNKNDTMLKAVIPYQQLRCAIQVGYMLMEKEIKTYSALSTERRHPL